MKRVVLFLLLLCPVIAQAQGWDGGGGVIRGDGVRTGSNTWQQARDAGVKIRAEDHDLHDEILATAIENTVARDGQNTASANLPMGGFRHTGVGAASARTDYARASQVQDGAMVFGGTAGGSSNAYTMSLTPTPSAYVAGQQFTFIANHTNTGASTLNVNAIGATAIRQGTALTALAAGTIVSGQVVTVVYDGTYFVLTHGNALGGEVIMSNLTYSGARQILASATGNGIAIGGGTSIGTGAASAEFYDNSSGFNAGGFTIKSGNVSGANGDITNQSSNGTIDFNLNGAERWQFQPDGDLSGEVNNGGDIIFNRDEKGVVDSVSSAVSSAGANQGAATALTRTINKITTSGGVNTGVRLSANLPVGRCQIVKNQSGDSTVRVYPHSSGAIDDGTTNAHITIATATAYIFCKIGTNDWQRMSAS